MIHVLLFPELISKINQKNGIFLNDAHEKDKPDNTVNIQRLARHPQSYESAGDTKRKRE